MFFAAHFIVLDSFLFLSKIGVFVLFIRPLHFFFYPCALRHNYILSEKSTASFYQPSVTTDEIDKTVHKMIIDAGAYPSPLGYGGFPKSVCTSVNECMCHGIPDSRELQVHKSLH
jgi:hypothetical protein